MSITITCQACNKEYKLKDDLAGKKVKCRCGQAMVVPQPTAELSDLGDGDPMSSLLDEALPTSGEPVPLPSLTGGKPAPAPGGAAFPKPLAKRAVTGDYRRAARIAHEAAAYATEEAAKEKAKHGGPGATKLALLSIAAVAGIALGTVALGVGVYWLRQPGFRTIEETFTVHQDSLRDKQWKMQFRTFTPDLQEELLSEIAYGAMWRGDSNSPTGVVLKKYDVTEPAEEDDETYGDIVAELMPEALDNALSNANREPTAEELAEFERIQVQIEQRLAAVRERDEQRRKRIVSHVRNKPALYAELMEAMEQEGKDARDATSMPGIIKMAIAKEGAEARKASAARKLADVVTDGDTAQGQTTPALAMGDEREAEPISFRRIDGRWYIDVTKDEKM